MNYKIFIFVFLMAWAGFPTQYKAKATETMATDSLLKAKVVTDNPISQKKFPKDLQKKYNTEDFNYDSSKPKTSFWERLTGMMNSILEAIFGDMSGIKVNDIANKIITTVSVISIGILAFFGIKFLLRKDGNWIFGNKNKKIIPTADLVENIHEINFPETIAQYENEKNFRSAIRYQFLYMLKKLSDDRLIDWNPEKTNKDYINEIEKSYLQARFKNAAYIFDYVWYGEFPIKEDDYQKYKTENFNF